MKKIMFSLIVAFTILLLSNVESNGQCDSSYTSTTITLNIGGCDYDLVLCYLCQLTYPGEVNIVKLIKHPTTPPCTSSYNEYQLISYLYAYLTSGDFMYSTVCFWNKLSPCPYWGQDITFNFQLCWYEDVDTVYFNTSTPVYQPCYPSNSCEVTYQYCQKGDQITKDLVSVVYNDIGETCPEFVEVDPGECFIFHTICNP